MSEIDFTLRQGAAAIERRVHPSSSRARKRMLPSEPSGAEARPAIDNQPAPRGSGRRRLADVELSVHGALEDIEQDWQAFQSEADHAVFQSFHWLAKWQRHIGARRDTRPAIVLGRAADGGLLFVLPLAIETHGVIRRLTWLGSELCDYNAPLLAERFSQSRELRTGSPRCGGKSSNCCEQIPACASI